MANIALDVPTVHCTSCKLNIEESLEELVGIAGSVVDLEAKRVIVHYDEGAVDPDTIAAAIDAAGYLVSRPACD